MVHGEKCVVCNAEDVLLNDEHRSSDEHIFNFTLWEWKHYKKAISNDNPVDGVTTKVTHKESPNGDNCKLEKLDNAVHKITMTPQQFNVHNNLITYECTVINKSSKWVHIQEITLIHPIKLFKIHDTNNVNQRKIKKGESYKFHVIYQCAVTVTGSLQNSLTVRFHYENEKGVVKKDAKRAMTFLIHITDGVEVAQNEKSPFTSEMWRHGMFVMPTTEKRKHQEKYKIPESVMEAIKLGFNLEKAKSLESRHMVSEIQKSLDPGFSTAQNYQKFLHTMLWTEEMVQSIMLSRYNMAGVKVVVQKNIVILEVPGLAEKRPSVVVSDFIELKEQNVNNIAFRGRIARVNDKTVEIQFLNEKFLEKLQKFPETLLDVRFVLGRLPLERQHEGVDRTVSNNMVRYLFPDAENLVREEFKEPRALTDNEFFNESVINNPEQRKAVQKILYNCSQKIPYIVYGPPGTGKTVTIVEAILQIKRKTSRRVLVCAPSNAACDMITNKLMRYCNKRELIRVHSETIERSLLTPELIDYSNIEGGEIVKTDAEKLNSFRIVVTTLILVGRYVHSAYKPDVIFVDEAAQAKESEVNIAVGFLNEKCAQLILAGDPQQLGPICHSDVTKKYKFNISMLERLMEFKMYSSFNPNFITMLKQNFRSHPKILELPNKLFYSNKLEAKSATAMMDPIANTSLFLLTQNKQNGLKNGVKKMGDPYKGSAVEFCGVHSKERREGKSPSYFNPAEIQMVLKYVNVIVNLNFAVEPCEIGIITPYIRQVYQIRNRLKNLNEKYSAIEVGTTEAFQGREKRVIIISTVRAQDSLLAFDKKYNLGFVREKTRFNVAITRAMSKLIIIGSPQVLAMDRNNWRPLMESCIHNGAYFGAKWAKRDSDTRNAITNRLGVMSLNPPL